MSEQFRCAWCSHAPALLEEPCPGCGRVLTQVLTTPENLYGRALADLMAAEDKKMLEWLDLVQTGPESA